MSDFKSHLPHDDAHDSSITDAELSEVLFEIKPMGNAVKVSVIDPRTNIEVSIVGSVHATPYTLKMNALRKLKAAIRKAGGG